MENRERQGFRSFTESLKLNHEFKRAYRRGKSEAGPFLAVYALKNRFGKSRLGITVSTKVGKAVVRNRVRRRIREAYRALEPGLRQGYDIVIVARTRAAFGEYRQISEDLRRLLGKLKLFGEERAAARRVL